MKNHYERKNRRTTTEIVGAQTVTRTNHNDLLVAAIIIFDKLSVG